MFPWQRGFHRYSAAKDAISVEGRRAAQKEKCQSVTMRQRYKRTKTSVQGQSNSAVNLRASILPSILKEKKKITGGPAIHEHTNLPAHMPTSSISTHISAATSSTAHTATQHILIRLAPVMNPGRGSYITLAGQDGAFAARSSCGSTAGRMLAFCRLLCTADPACWCICIPISRRCHRYRPQREGRSVEEESKVEIKLERTNEGEK